MRRPVLIFALVCHLMLAGAYGVLTPAFEAPDETDHFRYAFHLANAGELPVAQGWASKLGLTALDEAPLAHHPPLYYAVLAATMRLVGASDLSPSTIGNPDADSPMRFLHGGDELAPLSSGVATLQLLRGWSVLFGLLTVLLVHRLGRLACPDRLAVADLAALLVACLPMWSFLSGVLNSDNLAILLSQATLLCLAGFLVPGERSCFTVRRGLLLGVVLGAALLTKLTAGFLVPMWCGSLLYLWLKRPEQRREILKAFAASAVAIAAVAGWIFLRNWSFYGDPTALAAHHAAFANSQIPDGEVIESLLGRCFPELFASALGTFGWMELHPPTALLWYGAAVALVGLGGLLLAVSRNQGPRLYPFLGCAALLVFASTIYFNTQVHQPQGRLLFPAIGPMAVLLSAGLCSFVSNSQTRAFTGLAVVPPLIGFAVLSWHFVPNFDPTTVPSPANHASLVGGITVGDQATGMDLRLEQADASKPPVLQWRDPSARRESIYSVYIYDVDDRLWVATYEWSHQRIKGPSFPIPEFWWKLLPKDRSYRCRVRRVPNWRAGERLEDVSVSQPVALPNRPQVP